MVQKKRLKNPIAKELRSGAYRHQIMELRDKDYRISKKDLEEILLEKEQEEIDETNDLSNSLSRDHLQSKV